MGPLTVPWMAAFAVLSLGLILSSLLTSAPERALVVVGQYTFAYVVLAYILVRSSKDVDRQLHQGLRARRGLRQCVRPGIYLTVIDETFRFVSGSGRLTSFMGNPNANANVIALALPLILYLWFGRKLPMRSTPSARLPSWATPWSRRARSAACCGASSGVAVYFALTINRRVLVGLVVVMPRWRSRCSTIRRGGRCRRPSRSASSTPFRAATCSRPAPSASA